jgi:hypothetical protein
MLPMSSGTAGIPQFGDAGTAVIVPVMPTTASMGATCAPGHYTGTFSGTYMSGAWLAGILPVDFATSDFEGKPGFEFWLEAVEAPCPPDLEFCAEAEVKGGKLRGFANPFSDASAGAMPDAGTGESNPFQVAVRFEIDLTGKLDCRKGKFRGELEHGCYDALSVLYRFAGTIESDYEHTTSAFKNGSWKVTEESMDPLVAAELGGGGVWNAKLADSGSSPAVAGKGLCDGMTGFDTPVP